MAPSTVELPCRGHRNCTFHKHWNYTPQVLIDTTPSASKKGNKPGPTSPAGLQMLPTELLLSITLYLAPLDLASLALTCRALAASLGPSSWKLASKAGEANWYQHASMLDLLQRDFASSHWWRCKECERFHPRRKKLDHVNMGADSAGGGAGVATKRHSRIMSMLDPGNLNINITSKAERNEEIKSTSTSTNTSIVFGLPKEPFYTLDFALLKAAMDRHFLGAPHGVCLKSLKCQGGRVFPISRTSEIVFKYDIQPRIVLDKLLLQESYSFTPRRTMFLQKVKVEEPSVLEFLETIGFRVCAHELASSIVRVYKERRQRAVNLSRFCAQPDWRCLYCPTQSTVGFHADGKIIVTVWQNFGSGRSPSEEWLQIARIGKEVRLEGSKKADIRGAYERILCSTMDEFKIQLERSDGRGNWYDPVLMQPVYKTLPPKLAEYL
ncbi:hypothetical protein BCR34DRAFT_182988 [Clohesyomyces aquaticus]|uniref:F-box domain-containing protein n=1 Tax=Clohesyomyces aquaticus TaxID=1231657 RepID=A0A1Y1ZYC4_9PLEO|nr:hypothetical protein BCR34DRAFT_182988 [Clohesyomyces aquaticus]